MHPVVPPLAIARQIGLLALLGFGIVTLSGPLLALASVLFTFTLAVLAFALLGLIVLTVLRALVIGPRLAWAKLVQASRGLGGILERLPGRLGRVLRVPVRWGGSFLRGTASLTRQLFKTSWASAKVVSELGLLTLTGVGVGALVGTVMGMSGHDRETTLVVDALAGGAITLVAGVVFMIREKRAAARQVRVQLPMVA
jgi:hypothetical protein